MDSPIDPWGLMLTTLVTPDLYDLGIIVVHKFGMFFHIVSALKTVSFSWRW